MTRETFFSARERFFDPNRSQMKTRGRRDNIRDARMNIHEGFFNPRESFFDQNRTI